MSLGTFPGTPHLPLTFMVPVFHLCNSLICCWASVHSLTFFSLCCLNNFCSVVIPSSVPSIPLLIPFMEFFWSLCFSKLAFAHLSVFVCTYYSVFIIAQWSWVLVWFCFYRICSWFCLQGPSLRCESGVHRKGNPENASSPQSLPWSPACSSSFCSCFCLLVCILYKTDSHFNYSYMT